MKAAIKTVYFTGEFIGSFDWELPPRLVETLSHMPEGAQVRMLEHLQEHVKCHLLMIACAMQMGPAADIAMGRIVESETRLTDQLMLEGPKRKPQK